MVKWSAVVSNLFLFFLVYGMSATVDIHHMRKQLGNRRAILMGLFLQFILLPFLGFAMVNLFDLDPTVGITLLVVTSSPGGSYSNWWCSLFNADLALSVAMTAISTVLSAGMLPLNLILYSSASFSGGGVDSEILQNFSWSALVITIGIVIVAIGLGLLSSAKLDHHPQFHRYANRLGNISGIGLIVFSVVLSLVGGKGDPENPVGQYEELNSTQSWQFYVAVAAPCVLGLIIANLMTTFLFTLGNKPERVTLSVECCYQNTGIATSFAINMFEGQELSRALIVPIYYGLVEAILLGMYCVCAWKANWTKAPADESVWIVIAKTYEVADHADAEVGSEVAGGGVEGAAGDDDVELGKTSGGADKKGDKEEEEEQEKHPEKTTGIESKPTSDETVATTTTTTAKAAVIINRRMYRNKGLGHRDIMMRGEERTKTASHCQQYNIHPATTTATNLRRRWQQEQPRGASHCHHHQEPQINHCRTL